MLLDPSDGPVSELINPQGGTPILLVCEHASPFIPNSLNALGLDNKTALSHIAWDPGALAVARAMSVQLDCPLVASRVSRLVYDCNRPPNSPSAIPDRSEIFDIPGNRDLDAVSRQARITEIYQPFRRSVSEAVSAMGSDAEPVIVTIHSFTPVYFGKKRDTEIGFLHDTDDRLAQAMLAAASKSPRRIELNEPYSMADGVTHTLHYHGVRNGYLNVMIEIRNDLIANDEDAETIASELVPILLAALNQLETAQPDSKAAGVAS